MPASIAEMLADWRTEWSQFWHLAAAFGLSLPIGWDRERTDHDAGLRTFPIVAVAVAACGLWLVGESFAAGEADARSRIVYAVMMGMGFLGGGAILKSGERVHGLTTAASLWNTAAVGLAVGADQFVVAVVLAAINFILLRAKRPVERIADDP